MKFSMADMKIVSDPASHVAAYSKVRILSERSIYLLSGPEPFDAATFSIGGREYRELICKATRTRPITKHRYRLTGANTQK